MPANRVFASFVKRFDQTPAQPGDIGVAPIKTLADFTPEERERLCNELRAPLSPNAPAYRPRPPEPVESVPAGFDLYDRTNENPDPGAV